jgi:2-dehydropantoate 2-reductase
MKIERVALIGAGAIGGYFIWGLSERMGDHFLVVAEGERAERLRKNGVKINGKIYPLHVCAPEEAAGADLLLIATKYSGLRTVLPMVKKIVRENTIVMSLLNGVDSEEIVAEAIGKEPIVNSYMIISSQRADGEIRFNPDVTRGLQYGEIDTPEMTGRCRSIDAFFRDSPCHATFHPDILKMEWAKFMRNLSFNLPQAITGTGVGSIYDSKYLGAYSAKIEQEVMRTAAACGVTLDPLARTTYGSKKAARYSTLQDLDAKRHTEVDMFCGVLMKKAAEHGLEVPFTESAYYLIKTLEEKNEGKFDYDPNEPAP